MKRVFICVVLSASVMLSGTAALAEEESGELIVNGGFEDALFGEGNWKFNEAGGWYTETSGTAELTSGEHNSGESSVMINNGSAAQRVHLERNKEYRLTFSVKADSECEIGISFNDGTIEWPANGAVITESVAANTEWQEVSIDFMPDASQDYVIIAANWDGVSYYIDDVSLKETDMYITKLETGVNAEGEISFESGYHAVDGGSFVTALYDENGAMLGCMTGNTEGTFAAVPGYGKYTVKTYVFKGADGTVSRVSENVVDYSAETAAEPQTVGAAESVAINEESLELTAGERAALDAIVAPDYAYNRDVVWTSSDTAVASVSDTGIVTAAGTGEAVITASSADGTLSDTCTVTVAEPRAITGLTLDKSEITLPELNSVCVINADGASASDIVWTSSDDSVAEVNNGAVTAVGEGEAVITASAGGYDAECAVTVTSSENTITNDTFYKDIDGNYILSQGGGIYFFAGKYYWYGCKYKQAEPYAEEPENGIPGGTDFEAFTCYSSTDLVNWEFEGYPMTRETEDMAKEGWVGRMGVAYNENTKKYVLVSQSSLGMLFASSDTPEGPYKVENYAAEQDYFVNGGTGDQTVFQDDDGRAYVICSSTNGREHLYVAPLRESDFLDIDGENVKEIYFAETGDYIAEDGSVATRDKKGIEGNCMFKYNGRYYFTGSDLYGWNSSRVFVLDSDEILGDYNADTGLPYIMNGTAENYAHNSQAGFYVTVHGSEGDLVIYCGDRWSDFAGNGDGYNQWVPLSFDENGKPYFNDVHQWRLDAQKGTWEIAEGNNYIENPQFEADRITVYDPVGWETSDSVGGFANSNLSGKHSTGNFVWQQTADEDYSARLRQDIDELPDGTYTLKAWVKSSGGQRVCSLYAESGGKIRNVSLKTPIDDWTEVVINDIEVKDGQCEIGLFSDSESGNWVQIDDMSLVKNVG